MRFTAASLAIVAGTALAVPQAQETVYSTKAVTITSCGPDVPDCPGEDGGVVTQTSTVDCEETPTWSTEYVTVTDCDSEDCVSLTSSAVVPIDTVVPTDVPVVPVPSSSAVPVVPQPQPSSPQVVPPYPTVPVPQEPITSTVTYSTCIPTVTSSVIVITPSAVPTGSNVPSVPVPGVPTGPGVVPPPEVPTGTPSPSG